jgi:hypothetical protein
MFGRECGIATGVILATSPLCWFQSEVALTTIVDSMFVTATMLAGWYAMKRGGRWLDVLVLALLLACVAGNRPQTFASLLPAWLYVFAHFTNRQAKLTSGLGLLGLFSLLWFVPMVRTCGGWQEYLRLLAWKAEVDAPRSGWHGGALASLSMIARACWTGLSVAIIIAAVRWNRRAPGDARLLGWWIAPMATLGVVMYTAMLGHVLSYFPALAIVAGRACGRWVWILVITLVNFIFFLGGPSSGVPLSARVIRSHDRQLSEACRLIESRYRPEQILICHREEFYWWSLRHFQYHLPRYRNTLLGRDACLPAERAGKYRICIGSRTDFVEDWHEATVGKKLLLAVPPDESVTIFSDRLDATKATSIGEGLFELPLDGLNSTDEHHEP